MEHVDGVRTVDFPMIGNLPRSAGISRMDSVAMETVAGKYSLYINGVEDEKNCFKLRTNHQVLEILPNPSGAALVHQD